MSLPSEHLTPLPRAIPTGGQMVRYYPLLVTMREIGRIINREPNLEPMLQQVCECLAQNRGFLAVWIGRPEISSQKIIPLAASGETLESVIQMDIRWDDSPRGLGPCGVALRTRQPIFFDNVQNEPCFAPWRAGTVALDFNSIGAFPLLCQERLFGVLTFKSNRTGKDGLDFEEIELLNDLAQDIGRAWQGIEDDRALRQAEKANREARDFYLTLLQYAPALIWRAGPDGLCDWFNETWLLFTGRSLEQESGNGWAEGVHPEDLPPCLQQYLAALQRREAFNLEYRLRRHDGQYRWITDHGRPFQSADGKFGGYIGYCYDVHDLRVASRALAEVENRQRVLLENIPDPVWMKDREGRLLLANHALKELLGIDPQDRSGPTVVDSLPPDLVRQFEISDQWVIQNGQPLEYEEQIALPGRSPRWFITFKRPLFDDHGQVCGTVGAGRDITRIKNSELELSRAKLALEQSNRELEERVAERTQQLSDQTEVLRQSEERWNYALSGSGDGVWDWDVSATKLFYSPKWLEILGYSAGEISDSPDEWIRRVHPDDRANVQAGLAEHFADHSPFFRSEHRLLCQDGSYKCVLSRGKIMLRDAAGQVLRIIGTLTDISERKVTEAALQESLARQRLLADVVETAAMPLAIGHANGILQLVNKAFEELTGYSRAELIGKLNWRDFLTPPEYHAAEAELLANALASHKPFRFEKEYRRRDGALVPVELLVQPVFDGAGNYVHFRAFIRDISEPKRVARELAAAMFRANQASQAKSEFLASLSHEIRTPLNAILGYCQILERDAKVTFPIREKLAIIMRNGEALLTILNDILDLAKIEAGQMQLQPVEFRLSELLEDLLRLFRPMADDKRLSLALVMAPDLPGVILGDVTKLRQILFNLLGNALKFTERGRVEIHVSLVQSTSSRPELSLIVSDTGPGIAPAEKELLFEKFQQAGAGRKSLRGIGLGLALCRQFSRLMGGEITLTSTLGVGSSFHVSVPVQLLGFPESPVARPSLAHFVLPAGQPPVSVLVVDDLPENRDVLQQMLTDAGFLVETAPDGLAALTVCRRRLPRLVLMDTRMPDMDGYETILRLRAEFPAAPLKIISVSAAAYTSDQAASRQAGADDFIAKPVNAGELFAKIGHLLDLPACAIVPPADDPPACAQLALSPDWCGELREALALGDFLQVQQLIERIALTHPFCAHRLRYLANQFDADALLELLPPPAASPESN